MTELTEQVIEELFFSSIENNEIQNIGDPYLDCYKKGFLDAAELIFGLMLRYDIPGHEKKGGQM